MSGSARSYTHNLTLTGTLSWYVVAVGAMGNTRQSGTKTFKLCNLPVSSVTDFKKTAPSENSMKCEAGSTVAFGFSWTNPSNWGGTCGTVKNVEVLMGNDILGTSSGTSITKNVQCVDGTLKFKARAYNGWRRSNDTSTVSFEMCKLGHCAKVAGLKATGPVRDVVYGRNMVLSWTGTSSWGNSCDNSAKQYTVAVTDGNGVITTHTTSTTSLTLAASTRGKYSYTVVAKKGDRKSPVSESYSFAVCELESLGEIEELEAVRKEERSSEVTFSWHNPADFADKKTQCTMPITYTTILRVKVEGATDFDETARGESSTFTTFTKDFGVNDVSLIWQVEITNNESIASVESAEITLGKCHPIVPTWKDNEDLVGPADHAVLVGNVTLEWREAVFGPRCNGTTTQNYTVYVDGQKQRETLQRRTLRTELRLSSGNHTWWIVAQNENTTVKSAERKLCVADEAPVADISGFTVKQNTPFVLRWTAR